MSSDVLSAVRAARDALGRRAAAGATSLVSAFLESATDRLRGSPGERLRDQLLDALRAAVRMLERRRSVLAEVEVERQLAELRELGEEVIEADFEATDEMSRGIIEELSDRVERAVVRAEFESQAFQRAFPLKALLSLGAALIVVTYVSFMPASPDAALRSVESEHVAIARAAIDRARHIAVAAAGDGLAERQARVQMAQGALKTAVSALEQHARGDESQQAGDAAAAWAVVAPLARGAAFIDSLLVREEAATEATAIDFAAVESAQRRVIEAAAGRLAAPTPRPLAVYLRAPFQLPLPRSLILGVAILVFAGGAMSVIVWSASAKEIDLSKLLELFLEHAKEAGKLSSVVATLALLALPAGAVVAGRAIDQAVQAERREPETHVDTVRTVNAGGADTLRFRVETVDPPPVRIRFAPDPLVIRGGGGASQPGDTTARLRLEEIAAAVRRIDRRLGVPAP